MSQERAQGPEASITTEDVASLLVAFAGDPGPSAAAWCSEHGVQPEAVAALAEKIDAGELPVEDLLMAALRLGYQARQQREPKGAVKEGEPSPFHIVQHVVVDTSDGSIVEGPDSRLDWASAVAHTRNDMAREAEARKRAT